MCLNKQCKVQANTHYSNWTFHFTGILISTPFHWDMSIVFSFTFVAGLLWRGNGSGLLRCGVQWMIATSLVFLALLGAKRFLKRQYVHIYMHIYNIIFKERDREYMCDWGEQLTMCPSLRACKCYASWYVYMYMFFLRAFDAFRASNTNYVKIFCIHVLPKDFLCVMI